MVSNPRFCVCGAALILAVSLLASCGGAQTEPVFWRGVFLFGINELKDPGHRKAFFAHLVDSLSLNVIQVRTYGHPDRIRYFLQDNRGLWVIVQDARLATIVGERNPSRFESEIEQHAESLLTESSHLRFYLKDEPTADDFDSFDRVSEKLKKVGSQQGSRARSITAISAGGEAIERYVTSVRPSELLIDPYFITNNIPHPTLEGHDEWARRAGILPWGEKKDGYGWYFGYLQAAVNKVIEEHHRKAAAAVAAAPNPVRLIVVPQLHGVLLKSTGRYDRDNRPHDTLYLRPPSASEIRLQYGLGMAYGAKGFIAYPYGYDLGFESEETAFPGLVSRDTLAVVHDSNFDKIFGRDDVWTGYHEKWEEVAALNRRLRTLGDTLALLTWIGAKSWTMTSAWNPTTTQTTGWSEETVTGIAVKIPGDPYPHAPQVEIGHLRQGSTDYVVVVNRRCANRDVATITITLSGQTTWQVADVERPTQIWSVQHGGSFTETFQPGEARVFRLEKVPN